METGHLSGSLGHAFASADWLLAHHEAKREERAALVASLGLEPGQRVLDVACGPGTWTVLLWRAVQPRGEVVGVDIDPALVRAGEALRDGQGIAAAGLRFEVGDFLALPYDDAAFDVAVFSNSLSYTPDPLPILREQRRVVRPGGRVICQHHDNTVALVHPVDEALFTKVLWGKAQSLAARHRERAHDWCVGKKLPGWMRRAGFAEVRARTVAVQKTGPLEARELDYYLFELRAFGELARPYLSAAEYGDWMALFDAGGESYILDRDDLYVAQLTVVAEGRV